MDATRNTVRTAFQSVDPFDFKQTGANAQSVIMEAATSYLARWTFGAAKEPFFKLVLIHALASPLHGGFENFMGGKEDDFKSDYVDQIGIGLKQLPTVYTAQYVVNTPEKGLRLNGSMFQLSDILITAGAKLITRPILKALGGQIEFVSNNNDRIDQQRTASAGAANSS